MYLQYYPYRCVILTFGIPWAQFMSCSIARLIIMKHNSSQKSVVVSVFPKNNKHMGEARAYSYFANGKLVREASLFPCCQGEVTAMICCRNHIGRSQFSNKLSLLHWINLPKGHPKRLANLITFKKQCTYNH